MRIEAITAGDAAFADVLPKLSRRFEKVNGFPLRVIGGDEFRDIGERYKLPSPHWIKAHLFDLCSPDAEAVCWVDADTIPLRRMFDFDMEDCAFAASVDGYVTERVYNFAPRYVNTGFFIAKRGEGERILEGLRDFQPRGAYPDDMFEQTWLNRVLLDRKATVAFLPRSYNWLPHYGLPPVNTRLWHFASPEAKDELRYSWKTLEEKEMVSLGRK